MLDQTDAAHDDLLSNTYGNLIQLYLKITGFCRDSVNGLV